MKAEWVYSIIRALEARLEYIKEHRDSPKDEEQSVEEALNFFKELKIVHHEAKKWVSMLMQRWQHSQLAQRVVWSLTKRMAEQVWAGSHCVS